MAVKIRLKKNGRKKKPSYRVVVMDQSSPRDGRVIETLGVYNPVLTPKTFEVDKDRIAYWLGVGAQATDTVEKLLGKEGLLEPRKRKSSFHGIPKKDRKKSEG